MKSTPHDYSFDYFFFCLGFCDNADPAAVFESLPVRPSFKTFEADCAAFGDVTLLLAKMGLPSKKTLTQQFPALRSLIMYIRYVYSSIRRTDKSDVC